jgi:hypothetical protein
VPAGSAAIPPSRDGRDVTVRELVLAGLGACALAVVMHWPLVLNLSDDVPRDLGDPLAQAWQVAWGGHALAHQPLHFFQSNQFWPLDDTLAFSDALIGYAPAGLIGSGPDAAVARYDLLFLFAYALAFLGAYLLARELGIGPAGAAVAGAAFAFAPFRLEQDGHLQVISSGGIPLCLALGVRGYRMRRPGWVIAAWLFATWEVSIGFTLGLPLAYLLAALGLVALVIWLRRGRPALERRLVVATALGAVIFAASAALIARPYVRVADEHPEAERPPALVAAYSGPPSVFLAAPEENLLWGDATEGIRDGFEAVAEKTLFPGLLILALAALGVGWSTLDRRLRIGLAVAAVAISVLALGFRESGGLLWPYRVVYEVLPGWKGIRTPGRLVTFSSLALALLAGAGAQTLLSAACRRGLGRASQGGIAAVVVLALLVEGRGLPFDPTDGQAQPEVPAAPADVSSVPAPQLHLPARLADDNRRYLLWSTDGFPLIVNGRSSIQPTYTARLIRAMRDFPDRQSIARLRREGVRSVILHLDRVPSSPQSGAARRQIAGLGLTRRRLGSLLVYEIGSPSAFPPGAGSAAG